MAIINRLARLFKADFHAVLDHIEEPELQLKQAVREMEEEVAALESDINHQKREIDALADRKKSADKLLIKTNDEIAVCIENNNDELARGLIRRKLETASMLSTIGESQDKLSKAHKALQAQHKEYLVALESMRQKVDLIVTAPVTRTSHADSCFAISEEDIEVALLKERQRLAAEANAS